MRPVPKPRPRLLRLGQSRPRRQAGRSCYRPQAGSALLPHAAKHRSHRGVRHSLSDPTPVGTDGRDRSLTTPGSSGRQLPPRACLPALVLDGLLTPSRPRSQPSGGHPIKAVVAGDTQFVEHRVNAERPQAATRHLPTRSHPSSSRRTGTRNRPHAPNRGLDAGPHTVNALREPD